jgi:hypothetical protein
MLQDVALQGSGAELHRAQTSSTMQASRLRKPRTLDKVYRDKCSAENNVSSFGYLMPEDDGVVPSKVYVDTFGWSVSKYKWCKAGSPNIVPDLQQVRSEVRVRLRGHGDVHVCVVGGWVPCCMRCRVNT